MFEKLFKGTFVLTVWGFIIVAVCALLPDSAWENFPKKLYPVREFLAEKNIISSAFRKENVQNSNNQENGLIASEEFNGSEAGATEEAGTGTDETTASATFPGQLGQTETAPMASMPGMKPGIPPRPTAFNGIQTPPPGQLPPLPKAKERSGSIPDFPGSNVAKQNSPRPMTLPELPALPGRSASSDASRIPAAPIAGKSLPLIPGGPKIAGQSPSSATLPPLPSSGSKPAAETGNTVASKTGTPFPSLPQLPSRGTANKDTLPNLAFHSEASSKSSLPVTPQNPGTGTLPSLPNQTAKAATPFPSLTSAGNPTPAAPVSAPVNTVPNADTGKLIGNATVPDPGLISKTSATAVPTVPQPPQTGPNVAAAPFPALNSNPVAITPPPQAPVLPTPPTTAPVINPQQALAEALVLANQPDQLRSAFFKLNQLLEQYGQTFTSLERDQLHKTLDRMAYTIFYDPRQHILEPAYSVSPNETLATIAAQYKITPELLAALNGLNVPTNVPLAVGSKLKVIRGPVSASVSMSKKELLLLFDGLYAGRFHMGFAATARNQRGIVSVTQKIQNPQYIGPLENGQWGEIAGGAANNPLGPYWIALNNGLGLQGTNHPEYIGNETARQGGLIFSNKDIAHLGILLPPGANIYLKD